MADVNSQLQRIIFEGVVVTRGEGTQRSLWPSGKQVRRIALRRMPQGVQELYCSGGTEYEGVTTRSITSDAGWWRHCIWVVVDFRGEKTSRPR